MPVVEESAVPRESLPQAILRALPVAAAGSAAFGVLESARVLLGGAVRYTDHGLWLVALALVGYALLGVALACATTPVAWILWRPPTFRAAPASTCGGLGAVLGVAAFSSTALVGARLLVPAAWGGALLCLALRELLAWWSLPGRARTWTCLLSLAVAANAALVFARTGSGVGTWVSDGGPNVLLISIDTLRPDHLGCYGALDARTPVIDALAAEGVLFEDATSQANTTGPSHTTILTGLVPAEHGATKNGIRIAHDVATLPEFLSEQGYATGAFVSGFTLKDQACGLAPRFDRYDDELIGWTWMPEVCARLRLVRLAVRLAMTRGQRVMRADRPSEETVDAAIAWLSERDGEQPWFLWTHHYDPHAPYEPPAPFDRMHAGSGEGALPNWYLLSTRQRRELIEDPARVAAMRALYKGEISYTDAQLGRLFDALRDMGAYENTLIVLTADHGETLGEHANWFDHSTYLYETDLAVPLILRLPGGASGERVAQQVRLLDLTPTVLDALGVDVDARMTGRSLLPLIAAAVGDPLPSIAAGNLEGDLSGYERDGRMLSLRSDGHKLIWTSESWLDSTRVPERYEFYDLRNDPHELHDLWVPDPDPDSLLGTMSVSLEAFRELSVDARTRDLDPETEAALRALGYL